MRDMWARIEVTLESGHRFVVETAEPHDVVEVNQANDYEEWSDGSVVQRRLTGRATVTIVAKVGSANAKWLADPIAEVPSIP